MATINDLNTSITDMSSEESITLLKEIRYSRRNPIKKKGTTVKKGSTKKVVDISAVMGKMSKSDRDNLLKELEEYL